MAKRKRIWALVTVGVAGVLGAGTMIGISAADASTPIASGRIAGVSSVTEATHPDTVLRLGTSQSALLRARRARVAKLVLAKFPHAKVLLITLRRDGTWLVTLRLADHRVGTVVVDRHGKVGPFHRLPPKVARTATTLSTAPQTGKIGGDGAISGPHW